MTQLSNVAQSYAIETRWGSASVVRRVARLGRRYPTGAAGLLILVAFCGCAALAPLVAPYPANDIQPLLRLQEPSTHHFFGTDTLGRDVFSRVLYGGRITLVVGFAAAAASSIVGGAIGLAAGRGRWLDLPLMRVVDGLMAFPGLLLALALTTIVGPHLWAIIGVLAVVQVPGTARLMRGMVLRLNTSLYIEAARGLGASELRIATRHLLPNAVAPMLVQATHSFAAAVLAEAALSYLGVGVEPGTPTWGNIIGQGRALIQQAQWLSIFPGLAIAITVLAISVLGDALRDGLDPTLSRRG